MHQFTPGSSFAIVGCNSVSMKCDIDMDIDNGIRGCRNELYIRSKTPNQEYNSGRSFDSLD
eukprot:5719605-Ditylum_brightwellii.AAC.1